MDLRDFVKKHIDSGADITIAATSVTRQDASGFGILKADSRNRITAFMEKPGPTKNIDEYKIPGELKDPTMPEKEYLASMGIYVFSRDAMESCLDNTLTDFGKEVIPQAIQNLKVNTYIFNGYWEDIGTIRSFYEANLDLTSVTPKFDIYNEQKPIYTYVGALPPSKMNFSSMNQSIAAEGCIITNSTITNSVIGVRTIIENGATLNGVVCMGADFYENDDQKRENAEKRLPNIGIGKGCLVKGAIIDKNARIGESCRIGIDNHDRPDGQFENYNIRDGIIVIPKNAVLYPGTVI
jgi:glucose-1-phosphate adenylyltransferase